MKLFGKPKTKVFHLSACVTGRIIPMNEISDSVFRDGILGICVGIEPDDGNILSPADGVITQISETSHAVGLKTEYGAEILIHAGIDTVQMLGEGFEVSISEGEHVKAGQLLLTCDTEKIREAGYETTVLTAVTNSSDFEEVKPVSAGRTAVGEPLIEIRR